MNKKVYVWIVAGLAGLLLLPGLYFAFNVRISAPKRTWFKESVHGDNYVVSARQVSKPLLPLGYADMAIQIDDKNNHQMNVYFKTRIRKDGGMESIHYLIEDTDAYIKIILFGSDQKSKTFCFYYEDYQKD